MPERNSRHDSDRETTTHDGGVLDEMRRDWNARAREDAHYYVAFGRREQDEQEFLASAADVVRGLANELKRVPGARCALEIGCGPGRLMRPMSRHFAEIHGVDVSDEMVRLARDRLRDIPHAYVHATGGADLTPFASDSFDFVYSYAVFQHIPSREVVFAYLREAQRVLRPGGVLRCQINGLPATAARYTTWSGVRLSGAEVREFARVLGWQLLVLEGEGTQYMWLTLRKRRPVAIRNVTNATTGEAASPASGRYAAIALWVDGLPEDVDLNTIDVAVDGAAAAATYIGTGEPVQVNAALPAGVRTGLVPVEIRSVGAGTWVRVIPPGPAVPRIAAVSDGINLLSGARITSGSVKVAIEEAGDAPEIAVELDGLRIDKVDAFCTDPVAQRWEFNFDLPPGVAPGIHHVSARLGRRVFPPAAIEVA